MDNYKSSSLLCIPGKCQERAQNFSPMSQLTWFQVDVVFLDFSKAFDCVAHQALLLKPCNFGIPGEFLNCLQDYLNNQRLMVVIVGYSSCLTGITSAVSQGSIFGPLFFFVLFLNDLPRRSLFYKRNINVWRL